MRPRNQPQKSQEEKIEEAKEYIKSLSQKDKEKIALGTWKADLGENQVQFNISKATEKTYQVT